MTASINLLLDCSHSMIWCDETLSGTLYSQWQSGYVSLTGYSCDLQLESDFYFMHYGVVIRCKWLIIQDQIDYFVHGKNGDQMIARNIQRNFLPKHFERLVFTSLGTLDLIDWKSLRTG